MFVFLLLIAPTSSVIPIRDVLAERRVYLPFIGLILIVLEPLRRLQFQQAVGACAAALVACTVLTYQRSDVWSTPLTLWQDSVAKSPEQSASAISTRFRAVSDWEIAPRRLETYEAASRLEPPDYRCWSIGRTRSTAPGRENDAITEFARAIHLNDDRAEAYVGLSAVYGKQHRTEEALNVLARAEADRSQHCADLRESWRSLRRY